MKRTTFTLGLLVALSALHQPLVAKVVFQAPVKIEAEPGKLVKYAGDGNLKMVQAAVAKGADVNTPGRTRVGQLLTIPLPPLHIAARRGHIDVAAYLISQGADVNKKDTLVFTPLAHAAMRGRARMISLLLKHGATVDARDRDGLTALHYVSNSRNAIEAARALVAGRPNVNATDGEGITPLHYAAMFKREAIARLLMKEGARVYAVDAVGFPPTTYARLFLHFKLAKILDPENRYKARKEAIRAGRRAEHRAKRRKFLEKTGII